MTPQERIARATRAQGAWEVIEAEFAKIEAEYAARMIEIANAELSREKRADKITALANAIRILGNLRNGLNAAVTDGDLAMKEKLRADKVEAMTAPQRRLLNIIPR